MQWLAALCVKRPIFASVLVILICVVGIAGYVQLGVDRFPNVDFPIVVVSTTQPGAAPAEFAVPGAHSFAVTATTTGCVPAIPSGTWCQCAGRGSVGACE